MNKSLIILVFSRNEPYSTISTINNIIELIDFSSGEIKILYIDDGSTESNFSVIQEYYKYLYPDFLRIIQKPKKVALGITSSILFGISDTTATHILPLPGHFMFDASEIKKLIDKYIDYDIVIGARTNLYESRPFGKFIAGKIYFILVNVFFKLNEFKDIHGLNIYPKDLLLNTLPKCSSHENHLLPILTAKKLGLSFAVVNIDVRIEHKIESKQKNRPNWPRVSDVIDSLKDLRLANRLN